MPQMNPTGFEHLLSWHNSMKVYVLIEINCIWIFHLTNLIQMFGQVVGERFLSWDLEEAVNRFVDQQPEDLAALDRAQAQGSEVVVRRAEELEGTGNRGRIAFGLEFRFFVDDQLVK